MTQNPTSLYRAKWNEINIISGRGICNFMFTAVFFITHNIWSQPKCSLTWIKKNIACTYNGILCIPKKEGNCAICNNMDDPREYYAKWNKPGNTGETLNDFTYVLKSKTVEFTEADNRVVVIRGQRMGNGEKLVK